MGMESAQNNIRMLKYVLIVDSFMSLIGRESQVYGSPKCQILSSKEVNAGFSYQGEMQVGSISRR